MKWLTMPLAINQLPTNMKRYFNQSTHAKTTFSTIYTHTHTPTRDTRSLIEKYKICKSENRIKFHLHFNKLKKKSCKKNTIQYIQCVHPQAKQKFWIKRVKSIKVKQPTIVCCILHSILSLCLFFHFNLK